MVTNSQNNNRMDKWYDELPTRFGISGEKVDVLLEPNQMYEKMMVSQAMVALEGNSDLDVHVLLDYTRASRGEHNSRSMLLPCLEKYPNQMSLTLFHTPNLRGVMKNLLPDRFNELLGLQHTKVYVFDDCTILSGANMSNDYFTNRQDRYIVIRDSPHISDYFSDLVKTISKFSYHVDKKNNATLHNECRGDPSREQGVSEFIKHCKELVGSFKSKYDNKIVNCGQQPDTWIYPLLQMGPFSINDDYNLFKRFLHSANAEDRVYLSTAYFNPLMEYSDIILEKSNTQCHILAASPQVNGFYKAAGIAGYIPDAYSWYEKAFLNKVVNTGQTHRVHFYEYVRNLWTFHAKGVWFYPSGSDLPTSTIIGSSNYGYRSVHRDLEAQVVIRTENKRLQERLHAERQSIYDCSVPVSPDTFTKSDRQLPFWVSFVARFTQTFF